MDEPMHSFLAKRSDRAQRLYIAALNQLRAAVGRYLQEGTPAARAAMADRLETAREREQAWTDAVNAWIEWGRGRRDDWEPIQ